jgi:hypothetical protein
VISRSFRNSLQRNRGQEPRTHKLWGVGPLLWQQGQTFCKSSPSASPSALCWPVALLPRLLHLSSPPALYSPPHLRVELESEASTAMATSTDPLAWSPGDGGLHRSASAASFLRRGAQDGGTSCRWAAATGHHRLGPHIVANIDLHVYMYTIHKKWRPSYGFITNGWRQKESIKEERKNKE